VITRAGALGLTGVVVLASLAGCGAASTAARRSRAALERAATRAPGGGPQRTPPRSRRPAEPPVVSRPIPEVLGEGTWVAIMDASSGLVVDEIDAPDPVAWIGVRLDRSDAAAARTLLRVRRAAFGVHVPRAGERREVPLDVLEERGLAIDTDTIVLFGPDSICPARRGAAMVTAIDDGGHALDVRWRLEGCPTGPWAPFGLSAPGIPTTLRWVAPDCASTADDDPPAGYGRLVVGEWELARFDDAAVWVAREQTWTRKPIATAGSVPRGCSAAAPASLDLDAGEPDSHVLDSHDLDALDPDALDPDALDPGAQDPDAPLDDADATP
jgi:hypothetical protein